MNASEQIDQLIAGIEDWRGETFAALRKAVLAADPDIVEEWKWMGSPVWSCDGMIAVANAHKGKVKLTFAHGARLEDPDKLFNAGLAEAVGQNGGILERHRCVAHLEIGRLGAEAAGREAWQLAPLGKHGFGQRQDRRAFFAYFRFLGRRCGRREDEHGGE